MFLSTTQIFFFLWILWVAVLVAIVGYSCREKGRREGARAVSRDVETPPNSDDGSGKTESRIIVLLPTLAAFIAFVLSIVPHTSCNFVRVNPWSSYDDHPFYSMGLWRAEFIYNSTARFGGEDECYSYRAYEEEVLDGDNYEMSTAIRMARASSILAILLGGMSLLVLLYAAFDHAQQIRWHLRKLCLPLFMATIFQALTFNFLLTNECQEGAYCNIHDGGLAAVTATMYWFLTGCGVSFLPPKPLVDQSPEK